MNKSKESKKTYYGTKTVLIQEGGAVNFNPDELSKVVGGEKLSYNEYIDIQFASLGKIRTGFEMCYFNIGLEYKGQIDKITNDKICFKRIFISGMYPDGIMFDDKEDHVWMSRKGFEDLNVGNSVMFSAEIYRYLKTSNGKIIDYSLRNPVGIKLIDSYKLPTDKELREQALQELKCEVCYLSEHCNRNYCILV